ncbi:SDR family NAD(P)-dependent oxidoreductase [Sinimarinibacterium sp. NLF-5-8]|uniref:SDR family NAD(P)-dependent oxidoreductase n=1 Tax=Sinimarinibacterium sp. NLF-5-8 TaxID=2698684 RepID=UPI00137C1C87|nr:SDR family NAD(P)-dependent oxidoreductase [Sinimarinibacterium sp. NLF-5-8]QHS09908.1 SDR family NAD(P)-dependent oxidoreductase [Sinimarinibacterium sp. NLF-5-8]
MSEPAALPNQPLVVVTGASGALGQRCCEVLGQARARVVGLTHRTPTTAVVVQQHALDLNDTAATQQVFARIARTLGRIDALINIAGGFVWQPLAQGGVAAFDAMYQINLRSTVSACHAALPHLKNGARIINIGAASAQNGGAGMSAYAAAKAGVARLTESLAAELAAQNIHVNALLPGIIDTPANRADIPDADPAQWVSPDALIEVLMFLLTPAARAINGALIPVAGR